MELQLGLALSAYSTTATTPPAAAAAAVKVVADQKQKQVQKPWRSEGTECYLKNKRSFREAFKKFEDDDDDGRVVSAGGRGMGMGMPLLIWHGQPNEEDDDHRNGLRKGASCPIHKKVEEGKEVVGWPPVKSWRKRAMLCQHQGGRVVRDRTAEKERGRVGPTYVKVKMEGVAIARKINLKLYQSYKMLTNSLIAMFARCNTCDVDCLHYTLTYQDKEGDWLLAGDVPWKTFIDSVQRLELVRSGG